MSLLGLPIGFYGYIFPGNINIMVMDLYGSKRYKLLLIILVLIVVFESFYCIVSLFYLNALKTNSEIFSIIEMVSFLMVLTMGSWMLLDKKNKIQAAKNSTLFRGVLSVIIHPQQIPFWIIIGVFVNPVASFGLDIYSTLGFIFFNSIGTLSVMFVYMIYGNKLMAYFQLKTSQLNSALGMLYISLAVLAVCRFLIK